MKIKTKGNNKKHTEAAVINSGKILWIWPYYFVPDLSVDENENTVDNFINSIKATHCTYHIGNSSYKNWQGLSINTKSTKSLIDCDSFLMEWGTPEETYRITPDSFYLSFVKRLPNIELIITEDTSNFKHFITVLNDRNQWTREQIYNVEIEMFNYFDLDFNFSVYHMDNSTDIMNLIKDRTVLFFKKPYNE